MINDSLIHLIIRQTAGHIPYYWDDLKQEIDIAVWQNPDITPFELRCDVIDYLRKQKDKHDIDKKYYFDPESAYISKIDLKNAVSGLKVESKRIISLSLEGYTNREISKILGQHETGICNKKRVAIMKLRRVLNG